MVVMSLGPVIPRDFCPLYARYMPVICPLGLTRLSEILWKTYKNNQLCLSVRKMLHEELQLSFRFA